MVGNVLGVVLGVVVFFGIPLSATIDGWKYSPDTWRRAGYESSTRVALRLAVPLLWACMIGWYIGAWYWLRMRRRLVRAEAEETLAPSGIASHLAGANHRDELTEQALLDAQAAKSQGLREFTVTIHSNHGGLALLPRLTQHVVQELQGHGFSVVNVATDDWGHNSHITCRVG